MFCTVCASVNSRGASACGACGATLPGGGPAAPWRTGQRRATLSRALSVLPLVALAVMLAAFGARQQAERARAAAAYADGDSAWAAGRYLLAIEAFTAAGDFRDAPGRLAASRSAAAPDLLAVDRGVELIAQGEYGRAIETLLPAARHLPELPAAAEQLAEARRLEVDRLVHAAEGAAALRDWMDAERSLRAAAAIDPADPEARARLGSLLDSRGPVLFSRDQVIMVSGPDGQDDREILAGHEAMFPTWSPDRSAFAFFAVEYMDPDTQVGLYLHDLRTGGTERLAGFASAHTAPVWSPDGRFVAYTSVEDFDPIRDAGPISVRLVDIPGGRVIDVTGADFGLAFNPAFSPDGRTLYFITKDRSGSQRPQLAPGDLRAVTLDSIDGEAEFLNLTGGTVPDIWSVHPAPAGRQLLVYSLYSQQWYEPPRTAIRSLDPASGEIGIVDSAEMLLGPPVWSPDGSRYAFADTDRSVTIVSADGATRIETGSTLSNELSWSPDGGKLLAASLIGEQDSAIIEVAGREARATDVALTYDAESPYYGPPTWAPLMRPPDPGRAGAGLDASE
ncbi:MAG: hypothetical protein ACKOWF_02245 [Chloroflexota bacterium]